MEVYGCPHCYPANAEIVRICPVCKAGIKPDGYVIGRLFERPDKQHLHVLGCTGCYRGSSGKR